MIKVITAPASEPVTIEEAKLHCRVDGTEEDTLLTNLIVAAREYCEGYQNRSYLAQTIEETLDGWPSFPHELPRPPLASVTSIKYYDTANTEYTLAGASYFVDADSEPGRVALAYGASLPTTTLREIGAVKIRYTAGGATVPQKVKQSILMLVAHWYANKEATGKMTDEIQFAVHSLLSIDRMWPV